MEQIDYVATTKFYLKNYKKFGIMIANAEDEMQLLYSQLNEEPAAPISRYGDEPAGGKSELTPVEAVAARREHIAQRIEKLNSDVDYMKMIIKKIDRSLDGLDEIDKSIVAGFYMGNLSWQELGQRLCFSADWVRNRGNKAVQSMTEMVFCKNKAIEHERVLKA